jgi:hypothetical protein
MRAGSIVNWFRQLYRELSLNSCSSHSGRRTFITNAARLVFKAGGSLRDVQQLAGHRSIEQTQAYIAWNFLRRWLFYGLRRQYCKIWPLSPNAFFFARGVISAIDNNTNSSIFDARDIAKSVYVRFGNDTARIAEVAREWALQMESIYDGHPGEFARGAVDGIMADGFFVGLDMNGNVTFAGQNIQYQSLGLLPFVNAPEPMVFRDPADAPTYVSGYQGIIDEFKIGHETERARGILAELGILQQGPDGVTARYAAYVAAVRDWAAGRWPRL